MKMLLLIFKIFAAIIRWSSDNESLFSEILLIIMEALIEWLLKNGSSSENSVSESEDNSTENNE